MTAATRWIIVGTTVRITDTIWGEVKEVEPDYFGKPYRVMVEIAGIGIVPVDLDDLPLQVLDS